jgi:hypothetical protein
VLQVAAINPAGRGQFSAPIQLRTGIAAPAGPVLALSAIAQSSTSVRVTWQPPLVTERNGPIVAYFITVARCAGSRAV